MATLLSFNPNDYINMKRQFLTLTLITASLLGAGQFQPAQAQDVKLGLIDFARMQRQFYRTDSERKQFEDKRTEERNKVEERKAKLKELIQAQQDAQKQLSDPTLSEDKKKSTMDAAMERQGQITSAQREILELETRLNKELADSANEIQRSLTKEIYDVIGKVAESKGLDVVLNRTFGINGVPTVAYSRASEGVPDFTDEVIAELNKNAPAGWTPPAESE